MCSKLHHRAIQIIVPPEFQVPERTPVVIPVDLLPTHGIDRPPWDGAFDLEPVYTPSPPGNTALDNIHRATLHEPPTSEQLAHPPSVRGWLDSDGVPVSEQGMVASYKFIQKFWILHNKICEKIKKNCKGSNIADLDIFTNRLIKKISLNLEKFNYNVIVANIYETYNFLIKEVENDYSAKVLKENYIKILILMMPVIPHIISKLLKI